MQKRETHKIDATGQPLGRLASQAATLLRGKHKPSFVYNLDNGDFVQIFNAAKIKLTGKKIEQKKYHHYSNYPGGLKTKSLKEMFAKNPAEVVKRAVHNMLPKNKLQKNIMKRLKISG